MLSAIRHAVVSSRDLHSSSAETSLDWKAALWLATAGGAEALGLHTGAKRCGRLRQGFVFDAILVDAAPAGVSSAYEATDFPREGQRRTPVLEPIKLLERFLNLGDDRNVVAVFVD